MTAGWKTWKGPQLQAIIRSGGREAVRDTANVILEASKQQVPHDEGTLQDSGIVVMAPGNHVGAAISYGGGSGTGHPIVPYAVRWHEEDANFQKGRKSNYLRDPVNQLGPKTYQRAMQKYIGSKLR